MKKLWAWIADSRPAVKAAVIGAAATVLAAAVGGVSYIAAAMISQPSAQPTVSSPVVSTTSPAASATRSLTSPAQTASAAVTSASAQDNTPSPIPSPPAAGGSITGDWNVTYGAPATVTITLTGGIYTESAKTQVQIIPGVSCLLQPGTAIATFTRTGPGTYAGHAYVWSENTCTINGTTSITLALSSDGNTLAASQAHGLGILPTVIFTRIQGAHK
jgi:hypothetical protein